MRRLFVCLILAAFPACGGPAPPRVPVRTIGSEREPIHVRTVALDHDNQPGQAAAYYNRQAVFAYGRLGHVDSDRMHAVLLSDVDGFPDGVGCVCKFRPSGSNSLTTLRTGYRVTVRGTCDSKGRIAWLTGCDLVAVTDRSSLLSELVKKGSPPGLSRPAPDWEEPLTREGKRVLVPEPPEPPEPPAAKVPEPPPPDPAKTAAADAERKARLKLQSARQLLRDGKAERADEVLAEIVRSWPDTPAAAEARKLLAE